MGKAYDYDIAVIGGGPGGYVAANRAAQLGAKVALIERGQLGGVCTNVGCIPTKALVRAARALLQARRAEKLGLRSEGLSLDFARTAEHRDDVVQTLRKGVASLLKANGVELVRGGASFEDEHTLKVSGSDAGSLSAEKVFIATGSGAVELPEAPFDGERVIDSSVGVLLEELPQSLLIVGAGYIGCEFAGAFTAFGVEITLVEMMDRILPEMDEDCAREVHKQLKKQGCTVLTGARLSGMKKGKSSVTAMLSSGDEVKAEKALLCVGRRPSAGGLDLEKVGVETDEKGGIAVNEHMQTSQPHIYAIGDATGRILLAHVASQQGLVAAAHATGSITAAMDYGVVPACAFTFPEVASVGLRAEEARQQGIEVSVKKFPFRALGKAHVDAETDGFVKMLAEPTTGRLLGVHIAAEDASSLVAEAALALRLECTAEELAATIHAHPTLPESLREAAEGLVGLPVNWSG